MRKYILITTDILLVLFSPFVALLIRDNFVLSVPRVEALLPYAGLTLVSALIVFAAARIHRSVPRYTSLNDIMLVIAAATIAILLASSLGFAWFRMEGIARSIPVIQWLLLLVGMSGARVTARILFGREQRRVYPNKNSQIAQNVEHVLVLGFSNVAQLYLSASDDVASRRVRVEGILADGEGLRGRLMEQYKVIGAPEDIKHFLRDFLNRGIAIERIVFAQPLNTLSPEAQAALRSLERTSAIKLDFFIERLSLKRSDKGSESSKRSKSEATSTAKPDVAARQAGEVRQGRVIGSALGRYSPVKRAFDVVLALVLMVLLVPLLLFVSLMVTLDLGRELVFWQQRPGRLGWPFRLYKLRTMRPSHDDGGNAIPDDLRMSRLGRFLRRTRFDELPQLYNILVGEMSFVGPRPLLWRDQVEGDYERLAVRPGLTGWAQVNGGRALSVEDKWALDIWYVDNASLWLDLRVLVHTVVMILFGEKTNAQAIRRAWKDLKNSAASDRVFLQSDLSAKNERLDVDRIGGSAV